MKKKESEKTPPATKMTNNKETADAYFKMQVHHPGMFFCMEHANEWYDAEKFVRKVWQEFPDLKVLAYFEHGKKQINPAALPLLLTDKKDFNLLGKEKQALKNWLRSNRFDLVFIFVQKENKRCKKLAFSIKAKLKAGPNMNKEKPWCDISIGNPKKEFRYEDFYEELKMYFNQLNIKLLQ